MILDHDEANRRLSSVDNLFNQLVGYKDTVSNLPSYLVPEAVNKSILADNLAVNRFIERVSSDSFLKDDAEGIGPDLSELIPDAENLLKEKLIKTKAEDVLVDALDELKLRLAEVESPVKLSKIAVDMSKIANVKSEQNVTDKRQQVIIYKPAVVNETHYEQVLAHE